MDSTAKAPPKRRVGRVPRGGAVLLRQPMPNGHLPERLGAPRAGAQCPRGVRGVRGED